MPTYEYACDACGHTFEEFQSMTAKPLKVCPACGKRCLRRLIGTGAALLFRGSGFYATDYRSSDYKQKAKSDKPPSASGDGGKSDAKPSDKKTDSSGKSGDKK